MECVFPLFLPLNKQSPTKKGVLLYICPYSNQSSTKNGVFAINAVILTKVLPKRVFSVFLSLF